MAAVFAAIKIKHADTHCEITLQNVDAKHLPIPAPPSGFETYKGIRDGAVAG